MSPARVYRDREIDRSALEGMRVAVAARNPDKPVLEKLTSDHGVRRYACDAAEPDAVAALFRSVEADLGRPKLVVHNIDGRMRDIFRKEITEADPELVLATVRNSAFSAFLVGQQAAQHARRAASRRRTPGHHHLHQRECGVEGLPEERRLRDRMPRQGRPGAEHG